MQTWDLGSANQVHPWKMHRWFRVELCREKKRGVSESILLLRIAIESAWLCTSRYGCGFRIWKLPAQYYNAEQVPKGGMEIVLETQPRVRFISLFQCFENSWCIIYVTLQNPFLYKLDRVLSLVKNSDPQPDSCLQKFFIYEQNAHILRNMFDKICFFL